MLDINKFSYEEVEKKWFDKGEIAPEEISSIFGLVEVKEARLTAIYDEIRSIPKEQCTPLVQEKIESILALIKG